MSLWQASLVFIVTAGMLVQAGAALAAYGDQIAERLQLSRLFVGTLLLAFATSLPELMTDVTAAQAGAPDLAVGDLFGSSMANMAILAIIDLFYRGRVWPTVELGHARVAAVAIALTSLAALSIYAPPGAKVGWVGITPILIVLLYVAAIAWFRRTPLMARRSIMEPARIPIQEPTGWSRDAARVSIRGLWIRFGAAAGVVLVTAPIMTLSVKAITDATGIAQTFMGAALLAVTTSLPELIASLAAIRIGSYDLAVGNLFGSNVANMSVLFFADLAYTEGPILSAVASTQIVTALGAILLMAIAVAAIVGESETRVRRLEPDAIVLLLAYAGTLAAVALAN
jgi:cation:H+ antiporter